jgi:hypothetical protein
VLSCKNFTGGNNVPNWLLSSLKPRSILKYSTEIYFIFFWVLLDFLWILNFIWISRILNENENLKPQAHSARPHCGPQLLVFGLAQRHNGLVSPCQPTQKRACSVWSPRLRCSGAARWHVLYILTSGLGAAAVVAQAPWDDGERTGQVEAERGSPVRRGDDEVAWGSAASVFHDGVRLRFSTASFGGSYSTTVGRGVRRG